MHEAAQINLIIRDLAATRAFYERFGWSIREMGDSALMADAGGVLVAFHRPDFTRTWNEGYDGELGGSAVIDVSPPDRRSVDRLHVELVAAGHDSPQAPTDPSSGLVTRSWPIRTGT